MLTAAQLDTVRRSLSVALRSAIVSLPCAALPLRLPPVVVGNLFGRRGPLGGWLDRTCAVQVLSRQLRRRPGRRC